ncbi:MAG: ATP-binding cassette domain-containing protein, partial [Chloroflexi bacterium]|nr:ATP-binding cassette domain-containing protein [Chloroflexota bacterium]
LMVGRDVVLRVENRPPTPGEPRLEVVSLGVLNDEGSRAVRGVSLTIRRGEILGVAGVSGNGQKELFDALVGARPAVEGEIRLDGEDLTRRPPSGFAARGVSGIPADRIRQGLVMDFRVDENLILGRHRQRPFAARSLLRWQRIAGFARDVIRDYEIAPPSAAGVVRVLSGGNLQKVVVARELAQAPKCLIVSQPTRGLDVAATEYVHRRLLQERDRGAAILLLSEDLAEVMTLATRIAVLFRGQLVGEMAPGASMEAIGLLMAGVRH